MCNPRSPLQIDYLKIDLRGETFVYTFVEYLLISYHYMIHNPDLKISPQTLTCAILLATTLW